jgi:hypothetical protein
VVQFIVAAEKIGLPHEPAILRGTWVEVNHAHGVVLSILARVQQRDVSQTFRLGLHRHTG